MLLSHRKRELRLPKQIGVGDNADIETDDDDLVTIDNLRVASNLRNLYKYVKENGFETIEDCNRANMNLFSRGVLRMLRENDPVGQPSLLAWPLIQKKPLRSLTRPRQK